MKKLNLAFAILAVLGLFTACTHDEVDMYVVNGQIDGTLPSDLPMLYLRSVQNQELVVIDSVKLNADGSFKMQGAVAEPTLAYLDSKILKSLRRSVPLFLENKTNVSFTLHLDSVPKYEAKGNAAQDLFARYQEVDKYDAIWQDYYFNTFKKMSPEDQKANEAYLDNLYDSSMALRKTFVAELINKNLNNYATPYMLLQEEDALGEDEVLALFSKLGAQVMSSQTGKTLTERVNTLKKTQIGQPVVTFSMQNTKGKMVNLADAVEGKVVLLDFWASWCGPCRAENPNVVANYKKYHKKGFEVIGISLDQKKDSWLEAIEKDGLTWLHLSDLKGWKCDAAKLYGVRSIPQNVLLDKNGTIIAKNLRGDDLGAKLAELYK